MASECAYGSAIQTATEQYACAGPCGCFLAAPGECLECWAASKTYSEREVRMLPPDDPRRERVRPNRARWAPSR